jgi:chorismate synthase
MVKYGFDDARPVLERASARETAARVAVGAVAKALLSVVGVAVGSYVMAIGDVVTMMLDSPYVELWARAEESDVRCPDPESAARMRTAIDTAREGGDSLGGLFVIMATGVPVGLGSHAQWDRRLDALLAFAVTSIQAVKGVEIGTAFVNARLPGTQVHDPFLAKRVGAVTRSSNHAGGIEGGMSNGMPIVVHAAMKPIPTTVTPQPSVDLATGTEATTQYQRSDVCAVPAASIVGEAMVAWVLAEALLERYGGDDVESIKRAIVAGREARWMP